MKKDKRSRHQLRLDRKTVRRIDDTTMTQVAGGNGESDTCDDKTIGVTSCCFTGVPSCH